MNNLISPQDYLTNQKPRVEAPAASTLYSFGLVLNCCVCFGSIFHHYFIISLAVKSNPAKPTIAYKMHVSREPQDDGYTVIPSPEKMVPERNESDLSLTFESSSDTPKRRRTPREVKSRRLIIHEFIRFIFLI